MKTPIQIQNLREIEYAHKFWNLYYFASAIWFLMLILSPLMIQSDFKPFQVISTIFYFLSDPVCHQLPERSFWMGQVPLPVCIRCFSIYGGILFSLTIIQITHRTLRFSSLTYWVFFGIMALVAIAEKLLINGDAVLLRTLGGFFAGILVGLAFTDVVVFAKRNQITKECNG